MSPRQRSSVSSGRTRTPIGSSSSRLLALLLALVLVIAACGGDDDTTDTTSAESSETTSAGSSETTSGDTDTTEAGGDDTTTTTGASSDPVHLEWAISSSPDTLFAPTYFNSPIGSGIMGLVYDNLLVYTGDNQLVESLATSWEAAGPTTYRYTVRDDVVFSDGSPVTIDDVLYSFEMQMDPDLASKQLFLFENIASVTAEGNDLVIELTSPDSSFKFLPTHMGAYIVKKDHVEPNYDSYGTPETLPIGSGPYMVEEFVPDSHVSLVRNPNYWGDAPPFDTIRFPVIPDDQTRFLAMQSGDINGTFHVPSGALDQWDAAAEIVRATAFIYRGFTIDIEDDPFDDIHVRRALYHATDREGIVAGLFPGTAEAATTKDPPSMFEGLLPASEVEAGYAALDVPQFDLDLAREELAQSKVPDGFEMVLNVPDGSDASILMAQAIKETWAQIGVDVELNLMPGGPRFQIILDHEPNLGVQIIGNLPDLPDPAILPFQYFHSSQAAVNANNSSNLRDGAIDGLLDTARSSADTVESAQAALQAQIEASKFVPIIPVLWSDFIWAVQDGWSVGPMNGSSVSNNFVSAIVPGS